MLIVRKCDMICGRQDEFEIIQLVLFHAFSFARAKMPARRAMDRVSGSESQMVDRMSRH